MKKTLMITFVLAAQGLSCTADNPGAEKPTETGGAGGATGGGSGGGGGAASAGAGDGGGAAASGGTGDGGGAAASGGTGDGGGAAASGGAGGAGGSGDANASTGPCDLYASGGTPCVAAHSTVRALFGAYAGKLYQVRRASDNATKDISVLNAGGPADSAPQDAFCAGTSCVITVLYDQSGHGNDLWYQGSDVVPGSPRSSPAKATTESLQVSGSKVYSLYINPGNSYWRDGHTTGVPTGSAPEGLYMVTSGTHVNGGCCFDYGNSETTRKADRAGAMDAINFSKQCWFGGCSGTGPWVQADLEWGLFPGGSSKWNPNQKAFPHKFVTAILKNDGTTRFALKGGNAQSGGLTKLYEGSLPSGYSPMKKQGAIVLGSGGDCCKPDGGANDSAGTFYEGAIAAGFPSDATEDALQNNIIAAGYE
ncbi:arabinofuranosidase catalytic domain-containing protein [Sorangium sp. So ce375]